MEMRVRIPGIDESGAAKSPEQRPPDFSVAKHEVAATVGIYLIFKITPDSCGTAYQKSVGGG